MDAGRDFLLFIFFLIVLGIAWFLTGGPTRSASRSGWFLNGTGVTVPSVPSGFSDSSAAPGASDASGGSAGIAPSSQKRPQSPASSSLSPYADYVTLEEGGAGNSDPLREYVVIKTSENMKTPATISGWAFENSNGIRAAIGTGAEIPLLGQINAQTPVTLGAGSTVVVLTGRSPNGTSFRLNECTGYFGQFQTFTPSLPSECPRALDEALRQAPALGGNEACRQFLSSLNQCTVLTSTEQVPSSAGSACQNFAFATMTYSGCVAAHQRDPGFYRSEWRVFLNRDQELWKSPHDVVRLLDENRKVVAQLTY